MNFKVEQFFDYVQFEPIYTACYFGEINQYDSQIYDGNFIQTVRKSKYKDDLLYIIIILKIRSGIVYIIRESLLRPA